MQAGGFLDLCESTTPWGDETPCAQPAPVVYSVADLYAGYNLRGKTIEFTQTDNWYILGPDDEDRGELIIDRPASSGGIVIVGQKAGGVQENTGQIVIQNLDTGTSKSVCMFRGSINQWIMTSYAFPDDADYIVTSNTLPGLVSHDGIWGFDYALITPNE